MVRTRRTLLAASALLLAVAMLAPQGAQASTVGVWGSPFSEFGMFDSAPPSTPTQANALPTAVSIAVMPSGRIVYWDGLSDLADCGVPLAAGAANCGSNSRSRMLDLTAGGTPLFFTPNPERPGQDDLFCTDQRLLEDGRLLAAGGTEWRNDPVDLTPYGGAGTPSTTELFGSDEAKTYSDSASGGTWDVKAPMNHRRWYPTMLTLPNGKLFVAGGVYRLLYNDTGTNVHETEIYDPTANTWTDNGPSGESSLPLYARMHLMPDGKIFYTGTGQMWGPFGQAYDQAGWNFQRVYDSASNTWTNTGIGAYGARSGAFSSMLPLTPPYSSAKMLVAGGTLGTSPGSYLAQNISEIITYSGGAATSVAGPALNNARWFSTGVSLPDGTVLAFNGADKDEVIGPGSENAVRQAELFDGSSWIPLSSGSRDRTYHNSAILLGDGSVLVGGHSPINALYGPSGDNSMGNGNNFKDPSFERFEPPYLFRGTRPTISSAPAGAAWNSSYTFSTPQAASVTKVALVRLPSVTHTTDADMRVIHPSFTAGSGTLTVDVPGATVAPPGWYYLFVHTDNGQGETPSKARIVRIGGTALGGTAPAPFGV